MSTATKGPLPSSDENLEIALPKGVSAGRMVAEMRLSPLLRHSFTANALAASTVKVDGHDGSAADEACSALKAIADDVAGGEMRFLSDSLVSQSVMLDTTVTELMRRAWASAGNYPDAFSRYMHLALKAQAQSRATLEALAKLHQPREQIVRHVHVYEGGQAIVAEEVHHHAGGTGNAAIAHRPHAPASPPASSTALLGQDPIREAMPRADRARTEKMSNARGSERERRATRQPKRPKTRT